MDTSTRCSASRDGGQQVSHPLPTTQAAAALARPATREALSSWGLPDGDWAVDVCLVVTELVSNAVRHGGTELRLELSCGGSCVTVAVADDAPGIPRPRASTDDDEDGRGMLIVAALACSWGVEVERSDKRVWARLCAPTDGTTRAGRG